MLDNSEGIGKDPSRFVGDNPHWWHVPQTAPGGTVYPDDFANMFADSSFNQFADLSGDALDPAVVRGDIDLLEAATKEIIA